MIELKPLVEEFRARRSSELGEHFCSANRSQTGTPGVVELNSVADHTRSCVEREVAAD